MKTTKLLSYYFLAWLGRRIYDLRLCLESWNNQVDLWAGHLDPREVGSTKSEIGKDMA